LKKDFGFQQFIGKNEYIVDSVWVFIINFFTFGVIGAQPRTPMQQANLINTSEFVFLLKQKTKYGFTILYDKYAASLYGVISRIVTDPSASEDVLQEVFVKVWNNIGQYDESKGAFYTWLVNIARNAAIDHLRTVQRKVQLKNQMGLANEYIDERQLYHPAENLGLKTSIAKLEQKYRAVIDLLYFYGCTQEEVAKILNLPLGTVKTRARAALQILRNQLTK
jgi:RNA polymerase sigma factor (sigma-70 family)